MHMLHDQNFSTHFWQTSLRTKKKKQEGAYANRPRIPKTLYPTERFEKSLVLKDGELLGSNKEDKRWYKNDGPKLLFFEKGKKEIDNDKKTDEEEEAKTKKQIYIEPYVVVRTPREVEKVHFEVGSKKEDDLDIALGEDAKNQQNLISEEDEIMNFENNDRNRKKEFKKAEKEGKKIELEMLKKRLKEIRSRIRQEREFTKDLKRIDYNSFL